MRHKLTTRITTKGKFWRKPLVWVGGVATAVIGTVIGSVLSTQAQRIVPPPPSHPPVTPPSLPRSFKAGSGPLTVVSENPLNVDNVDVWSFPNAHVLSDSQLEHINSIMLHDATGHGLPNYLYSQGGYQQSPVETQLIVENDHNYEIRVIDAHVIKKCSAPLTGTLFYAQGQAADESIGLGFDLDSNKTYAKAEEDGNVSSSSQSYFTGKTVSIEPGKQQVFNMVATTKLHSCEFQYIFTILNGEKQTNQTIGNPSGGPFRISSLQHISDYSVVYAGGPNNAANNGRFIRVDPKTYQG